MASDDAGYLARSYLEILSLYLKSHQGKTKIKNFLNGDTESFEESRLPNYLVIILNRLSRNSKKKILNLIEEDHHHTHNTELAKVLLSNMSELNSPGKEYKQALADYARFFHTNHNLEDVYLADGRINVKALRRTGFLSSDRSVARGGDLVTVQNMSDSEISRINYVVLRDKNGKARMKLSPVDTRDKYFIGGIRFHSFVAEGEEVEFAGEIKFTQSGKVREMNLRSGHYMRQRHAELKTLIGSRNTELLKLAAEADERKLRKIVETDLKLSTENLTIRVLNW